MNKTTFTVADDKKTLVVERTFNAPRTKVWAAYSEADKIAQWWGPTGWVTEVKEMDFRDGGQWLYAMICKDEAQTEWFGKSSCGKAVYDKIDAENSISYTDYFTNEDFEVIPGMPTSYTRLDLTENNNSTTIVSKTEFADEAALAQVMAMGMQEGFSQTWDNLENYLLARVA